MEDTGGKPTTPVGDLILERFANEDVLSHKNDARLLAAKPRLSRDVVLIQESVQQGQGWRNKITYIERRTGLRRRLGFDTELADIVGEWDGTQNLEYYASAFARKRAIPKHQAVANFLEFARKLATLGLVTFVSK